MHTKHAFIAYVDESGDEGFKFGDGSSEWFILSALVTRATLDRETVKVLDRFRAEVGIQPAHSIHFRKLTHERRVALLRGIAGARVRTISVLANKPLLKATGLTRNPRLYFYCVRFLLERLSWLCRDTKPLYKGDGCAVKVIFSRRSATSYSQLQDYIRRLGLEGKKETELYWRALDVAAMEAQEHINFRGLQLADAVAGAFFNALDASTGTICDEYARMLKPVVYKRTRKAMSYGLKFMPDLGDAIKKEARFGWVRDRYA